VVVGIEAAYMHDDHSATARFVDGRPRGLPSVKSLVHVFDFLPWMHREDREEGG
jgi:hypothetical protein